MDYGTNLIDVLKNEPDLYKIIKNKDNINILKLIDEEKNIDFQNLKRKYIYIKKDNILYSILYILEEKKLIKKIDVSNNVVYYITDKGKDILKLYEDAKKELNV